MQIIRQFFWQTAPFWLQSRIVLMERADQAIRGMRGLEEQLDATEELMIVHKRRADKFHRRAQEAESMYMAERRYHVRSLQHAVEGLHKLHSDIDIRERDLRRAFQAIGDQKLKAELLARYKGIDKPIKPEKWSSGN